MLIRDTDRAGLGAGRTMGLMDDDQDESTPGQPAEEPRGEEVDEPAPSQEEDEVEEASDDSFPASDPPSFTGSTSGD